MTQEENNQRPDSLIKSIMIEQEEKTRTALAPLAVAMGALGHLKDRERDVIVGRFGLQNGKKATLEAVGKRFGITRERVRQIESAAVKRLVQKPTKELSQLIKIINTQLVATGGLISLESLADYLKIDSDERKEVELNALRLVMSANDQVELLKKRAEIRMGWAKKGLDIKELLPVIDEIKDVLTQAKHTFSEDELWEAFTESDLYTKISDVTQNLFKGILLVASDLAQAHDGRWGLESWPTVMPKRIRDKVYIILEQTKEPLHFKEITERLNRRYTGKKVLSRTVHNELIGDSRFILVGRGIYALKEWGYKPGVVADVIRDTLNDNGAPMSVEDVTAAVLKRRKVKPNTVVANLQNKSLFKKVGKGLYTLA